MLRANGNPLLTQNGCSRPAAARPALPQRRSIRSLRPVTVCQAQAQADAPTRPRDDPNRRDLLESRVYRRTVRGRGRLRCCFAMWWLVLQDKVLTLVLVLSAVVVCRSLTSTSGACFRGSMGCRGQEARSAA